MSPCSLCTSHSRADSLSASSTLFCSRTFPFVTVLTCSPTPPHGTGSRARSPPDSSFASVPSPPLPSAAAPRTTRLRRRPYFLACASLTGVRSRARARLPTSSAMSPAHAQRRLLNTRAPYLRAARRRTTSRPRPTRKAEVLVTSRRRTSGAKSGAQGTKGEHSSYVSQNDGMVQGIICVDPKDQSETEFESPYTKIKQPSTSTLSLPEHDNLPLYCAPVIL